MQFAPTLRALNTIRPVRAPVSVAPLPCAVRRSAPCVGVCNLRAGRFPGRVPPPPGAPTAPRWALRLPPPCALVTACGWRGLYAPTAPPNTPFGAIAARLSALRAAKLSFGAIRCWGVAPSRRGYRRSFCPLRGGAAHLRAYARRAMRGESPRAPHPNKTHSWNRPGCIRIVPRDTAKQTGNNHARACQSGGGSPQPPVICPFDPANEYQQ